MYTFLCILLVVRTKRDKYLKDGFLKYARLYMYIVLMNRGKKARKEKQKGGKKGQSSEAGPISPTEDKPGEDFIPLPTEVLCKIAVIKLGYVC